MTPAPLFPRSCFIALLLLFLCTSLCAQSPIDPGKLPRQTLFYALWHGAPPAEVRQSNSLFALWNDPQFAVARASFVNSVSNDAKDQKGKPAVTREQLDQYVTLLDNPLLIGYLRRPDSASPAKAAQKNTVAPAWNGLFFIYDRSGKEDLLSKAVLQMRSADQQDIPKVSELTVAGVSALKVERKSGITYWAEFSKYAVSANDLSVFEQILNVANGNSPNATLSQLSAYQEAKPILNGGLLEFFVAVPKADQIAANASGPLAAQMALVLSALKLESIHSLAGRVSLEGPKTRLTGAVLGDASPGTFFDIWPDGQTNPVSMGYLQPGTIGYGESEFNLPGIYSMLKRAFAPTSSAQTPSPLELMAQTRLGMPLPDALDLLTGEVAWIQTSPTLDDSEKLYLVGIRNKPTALKLTRTLFSDQITSERTEGDTTYLKISLHGGQSAAGVAQWNFYHLAMTPNLLFGSSKRETLQKVVAQTPAAPDPAQFKNLLAARAKFPEKLNGFSYTDLQKLDWPAMRAKFVAEANKSAQTANSKAPTLPNKKLLDWLAQVDPAVLHQYLHTMIGASWKDANGVHFEEWLD
jgi:hypothetical protein